MILSDGTRLCARHRTPGTMYGKIFMHSFYIKENGIYQVNRSGPAVKTCKLLHYDESMKVGTSIIFYIVFHVL